jgi:hypothetical protein
MNSPRKVIGMKEISFKSLYNLVFKKQFKTLCLIFTLITFFAVLIGLRIYNTPIYNMIKYILFQVFFIMLPGMLVYRILRFNKGGIYKFTLSYGFGIIFTILSYFFFYVLDSRQLILYVGPVLSFLEIGLFIKDYKRLDKKQDKNNDINVLFQLIAIFSTLVLITFFGLTLSNPMPSDVGATTFNKDLIWTISNAEALVKGYPPMDSHVSGIILKYHYFISVHLAVINYVTKINIVELFYKFFYIGKLLFLVFSSYILSKTFFKDSKKALSFTWVYFFTNCASMSYASRNGYGAFINVNFVHLTDDPFGFELAIAFLFLCVSLVIESIRCKSIKVPHIIGIGLFIMAAIGSKGPLGAILLLVLIAAYIIYSIKQRPQINIVLIIGEMLVIFLVMYFWLLNVGANSSQIQLGYLVSDTILKSSIDKLTGIGSLNKLLNLLSIPVHFVLFLPFAAIPFLLWFYKRLIKITLVSLEELVIGGIAICGILATYILKQIGHSEVYFIMTAIPFIELCAIDWLSKNFLKSSWVFKCFVIITLIVSMTTTFYMSLYQYEKGKSALREAVYKLNLEAAPQDDSMTKYDYEAMIWLKNNSKQNDIIATNRNYNYQVNNMDTAQYFYYSTFSERNFYLEGWTNIYAYSSEADKKIIEDKIEINDKIFSNNETAYKEIEKANINFLVLSKYINPNMKLTHKNIMSVFENRDVIIYKVIR